MMQEKQNIEIINNQNIEYSENKENENTNENDWENVSDPENAHEIPLEGARFAEVPEPKIHTYEIQNEISNERPKIDEKWERDLWDKDLPPKFDKPRYYKNYSNNRYDQKRQDPYQSQIPNARTPNYRNTNNSYSSKNEKDKMSNEITSITDKVENMSLKKNVVVRVTDITKNKPKTNEYKKPDLNLSLNFSSKKSESTQNRSLNENSSRQEINENGSRGFRRRYDRGRAARGNHTNHQNPQFGQFQGYGDPNVYGAQNQYYGMNMAPNMAPNMQPNMPMMPPNMGYPMFVYGYPPVAPNPNFNSGMYYDPNFGYLYHPYYNQYHQS